MSERLLRDWRTLERAFLEDSYPSGAKHEVLAEASGLTAHQVKMWFQNRRNRWKRSHQRKIPQSRHTVALARKDLSLALVSSALSTRVHDEPEYICVPLTSCKAELTPLPGHAWTCLDDPSAMVPVRISRPVVMSNDAFVSNPIRQLPATGMPQSTTWPNRLMIHEPGPMQIQMGPPGNYFGGPTASIPIPMHSIGMQGHWAADGGVPWIPAPTLAPTSYMGMVPSYYGS